MEWGELAFRGLAFTVTYSSHATRNKMPQYNTAFLDTRGDGTYLAGHLHRKPTQNIPRKIPGDPCLRDHLQSLQNHFTSRGDFSLVAVSLSITYTGLLCD